MKYIIQDWAGNRKISDQSFDSFEDAWDAIYLAGPENDKERDEYYEEFQVVEESEYRKKDRYLDPKDPRAEVNT